MDTMSPETRAKAMRANRGRTGPERALARALWRRGVRFLTPKGYAKVARRTLLGSPDIILSRSRIAVFVDGCFWHGCDECRRTPRGRYWLDKLARNRDRDKRVSADLANQGWTVVRIPEHDLRTKGRLEATVKWLSAALVGKAECAGIDRWSIG